MRLTILIENKRLDLFADEVIELNSSVANTDDVTKINTDYTKTFTVPASDNNNKIFKHYYNADIDNTFDSRTKTSGEILMDGIPFRKGKFRLEKVQVKKQKPSSYTINFWGDLINIKDLFRNDELNSLDFSSYNFIINYNNITAGLSNYIPNTDENLIYNLISSKRQFIYDPSPTNNTNTETLVNIAHYGIILNPQHGVTNNEINPSIRLMAIIEAIELKYDILFSRQFFSRPEFQELFMFINGGKSNSNIILRNVIFNPNIQYIPTVQIFPQNALGEIIRLYFTAYLSHPISSTEFTFIVLNNNVEYARQTFVGSGVFFTETTEVGFYSFSYKIESQELSSFIVNLDFATRTRFSATDYNYQSITPAVFLTFDISKNLPILKIVDFLKGLFQMFKLVAVPKKDGTIYINTIDEFYREGGYYDFTKLIDFNTYEVERGAIYNEINFKYQEPTTILNLEFKKNTGIAYADELLSLADPNGVPLDGDQLEINLPFEQPVYERLSSSNIQYALLLDDKLSKVKTKPIIFYNNNIPLNGTQISIQNGNIFSRLSSYINTPSQVLNLDAPSTSLNWGVEFSTWNNLAINKTLFSKFWENYILSVFNIKKRKYKYKAKLPVNILTKLELNDLIKIKERFYKINDFTVNLLNGETTLNLINSFDFRNDIKSNFYTTNPELFYSGLAQQKTIIIYNFTETMSFVIEDAGDGVDWVTYNYANGTMNIQVTLAPFSLPNIFEYREVWINVFNGLGDQFTVFIKQRKIRVL